MAKKNPEAEKSPESKLALLGSCALSALLLALFLWLQATHSRVMELKAQWLWIAVLPIVIGLVIGKYIWRLKVGPGGFLYESPEMRQLPIVPGQKPPESEESSAKRETSPALSPPPWTDARESEHNRTRRLFLVHVYEPSTTAGQKYDINIFLVRNTGFPNQRDGFSEVKSLELYFGFTWNNAIFSAVNNGGPIGIRTSAWAPFLATGRVTFNNDWPPIILHRYIDFEMAQHKT